MLSFIKLLFRSFIFWSRFCNSGLNLKICRYLPMSALKPLKSKSSPFAMIATSHFGTNALMPDMIRFSKSPVAFWRSCALKVSNRSMAAVSKDCDGSVPILASNVVISFAAAASSEPLFVASWSKSL